jgi:chemotaxis protein histidine kinase CheA
MTPVNDTKIGFYKISNRLKERLGINFQQQKEGFLDPAVIEEADKLIAQICITCPDMIEKHLVTLGALWEQMRSANPMERDAISIQVFTVAHELKDMGSLCGFDLIAHFAESLRDYIEKTNLNLQAQIVIIQAHIDAMKIVHHRGFKKEAGPEAEELKLMVQKAIDKYQ